MASLIDTSATSAAFFRVLRHERDGIVDDETRRRMRLIAPHIRRAVLVGRLVDDAQTRAAALADALDGLSAGVCLVDTEGRIVHANAAFHAILSTRDFLSTRCGRLVATDPKIDQTFRELFAAAGRGGDASFDFRGTALPLTAHDGVHYLIHLLPLTSGARRRASVGTAAVAALFVHKASLAIPSPSAILARHYNLTPTELRVLLAIVDGAGVRETAGALGIADSTVKTHLGRPFEKTGASRQADLVKIVAAFSTPLLGAIEPQRCGDQSIVIGRELGSTWHISPRLRRPRPPIRGRQRIAARVIDRRRSRQKGTTNTMTQPGVFPKLRFSTTDLPRHDRIAMWREHYAHTIFRVAVEPVCDASFQATVSSRALPALQLLYGAVSAVRISRTREYLARRQRRSWVRDKPGRPPCGDRARP